MTLRLPVRKTTSAAGASRPHQEMQLNSSNCETSASAGSALSTLDDAQLAIVTRARSNFVASKFVSIKETSEILGLSVRTIRRKEANGEMPAREKRSRKFEYRRCDIEAMAMSLGRGHR